MTFISTVKKIAFGFILAGLVLSCEQAFVAGLGPKVDITPPVLGTGENGIKPSSGAYLSAPTVFSGYAKDDIGISKVEVTITGFKKGASKISTETHTANYDSVTGNFTYNFIPADYDDGEIKALYTIYDMQGKTSETPELPYIIKNLPPQIKMSIPGIQDTEYDDVNLNTNLAEEKNWIPYTSDLMGMASDALGIKQGYPEIMFWPKEYNGDTDYIPAENDGKYGEWRKVKTPKDADGLLATQFTWPLKKLVQTDGKWAPAAGSSDSDFLEPGEYRFKVRVMDMNGTINTYPNRTDNKADPDGSAKDPADAALNQYMQIRVIATSNPRIIICNTAEKPFPVYYKGSPDPFIAYMTVTAPNPIVSVRGQLGNNDFSLTSTGTIYSAESQDGYEYTLTIPSGDAGLDAANVNQELFLEALDNIGNSAAASKAFQIDGTPPEIEIIEPAAYDARVTSTTSFRGSAEDAETQAISLFYALGWKETELVSPASSLAASGEFGWHDTGLGRGGTPAAGNIPVANSWKGSVSNWTWTFDNIGDITRLVNPGTAPAIGDAAGDYVKVSGTYGDDPAHPSYLYELPIKLKAVDIAGNIAVKEFRVIVDPDADAPFVEISSHQADAIVGGEVRLSGTASDNDWIYGVEIRVRKMPDDETKTSFNDVTTNDISRAAWLWTTGTGDPAGDGSQNWVSADTGTKSSVVSWFYTINKAAFGEADYLSPPDGKQRLVDIEVRAKDAALANHNSAKSTGPISRITLKFDGTVPTIRDIKILRDGMPATDYVTGIKVTGAFKIQAKIRDESGISSIKIRGDENTAYTEVKHSACVTGPETDENGMILYTLTIPIDSNSNWFGGKFQNKSGAYDLAVQVQDISTPTPNVSQAAISMQIDNYYPLGSYTSRSDAFGIDYSISGNAWDTGTGIAVQGVDRVVVYFSRNGNPISLWQDHPNSASHIPEWTDTQKARPGRHAESELLGDEITLPFFPKNSAQSNDAGIVINDNGEISGENGNKYIQFFTGNPEKEWSVQFDTVNRLNDGPITLHYVIFDTAGNASYFKKNLVIKNTAPSITNVILGTDLIGHDYGNENFDGNKTISDNWDNSGFTSRNNALRFRINSNRGNGDINYKVSYILGEAAAVTPVTGILKGRIYKIETIGSGTIWTNVGAPNSLADTVFIASEDGSEGITGTGTAREILLSETAQQSKSGFAAAGINTKDLIFSGNESGQDFASSGGIGDGSGVRFFIKVYDTMISGGNEEDQLSDFKIIGLNINNIDITPPSVNAAPFGWKYPVPASKNDSDKVLELTGNYNDNIVSTGSEADFTLKKFGYVQYAEHSADEAPKLKDADVSGKVVFTGKAADNQRIVKITAAIPGFNGGSGTGTEFVIAQWDDTALKPSSGHTIDDVALGNADWGFETVSGSEALTVDNGHILNWRFAWNSAALSTVIASDVAVTFKAYDAKSPAGNSANDKINVDVVPYIASVQSDPAEVRGLSNEVIRSSTGAYSIENSGPEFQIIGFNLKAGNTTPAVYITSDAAGAGTKTALTVTSSTRDMLSIAKAGLSYSGYLAVEVGGSKSINNTNNNDAALGGTAPYYYNHENNISDARSIKWTDDRYVNVWSLTQVLPAVNNQTFYYPSMVMNGNQPIFAYCNDNNGFTYRTTSDTATVQKAGIWFERATYLAKTAGNKYWMISAEDAFGSAGMGFLFVNPDQYASAHYGSGYTNATYLIDILGLDYPDDVHHMNRIKYPKLIAEDRSNSDSYTTDLFAVYYDASPAFRDLSFVSFRANQNGSSNMTAPNQNTPYDYQRANQVQVIPGTAGASSQYYDIVKIDTRTMAVAYFDEAIGKLKLKYSTNAWNASTNLSGSGTWTDFKVGSSVNIDASPLTGSHVSMAKGTQSDGKTYLYLAYHDSANTDLRFAVIRWDVNAGGTPEPKLVAAPQIIDSNFSVGTRTNVYVIDGIPYVSYIADSYAGTLNAMRIAYPVAANGRSAEQNIKEAGALASGTYTGNWEVMAVPTITAANGSIEQFNRTQLDEYTNGASKLPVVSWLGDRIEYAKFLPKR